MPENISPAGKVVAVLNYGEKQRRARSREVREGNAKNQNQKKSLLRVFLRAFALA